MRLTLLIILVLISSRLLSQNLVNNPGFENYTACPTLQNELNFCDGWLNCNGYYEGSQTCGSPDFLSTCGSGDVQLPNSQYATVAPHSGNCIADYCTYDDGNDYREYVETFLTSPMIVGQTYTVSYYLTAGTNQQYDYHTNNQGVLFSMDSLHYCTNAITGYKPQFNDTSVLDTTGWKLLTFEFTADSAYKYITIGDFYLDSQSKIEKQNNTGNPYSQVYLDDISVVPSSSGCNNPNIVNNPSFENYITCPSLQNELNFCDGWLNCNGYYEGSQTCGSPDFLSTCGSGDVQLPNSQYATVSPHNGNCIADYCTYDDGNDYREYVETFLTSPTIIGQTYTVSYYLTAGTNQQYDYHTNNQGVLFSMDSLHYCTNAITGYKPQFNDTNVLDTTGWKLLTFEFTADSAYKYITFGDFYLDAQSKIVKENNTGNPYSQVYLDDISVSETCNNAGINSPLLTHPLISFYPDPVIDYAIFNLQNLNINNKPLTFTIYNCLGQMVMTEGNIDATKFIFNRGALSAGLYFYQFHTENGSIASGKMILN